MIVEFVLSEKRKKKFLLDGYLEQNVKGNIFFLEM